MTEEQKNILEKINEKLLSNKKNSIDMARAEIENILNNDLKLKEEIVGKFSSNKDGGNYE